MDDTQQKDAYEKKKKLHCIMNIKTVQPFNNQTIHIKSNFR